MFLDGKAAQEVFRSDIKITLIPLDVLCCISLMNAELYRHLVKIENRSKIADFVFSGLNQLNYPFFGMNKSLYFLSSIGVYLLSNNEFAEVIPLKLRINLDYGPYYGMLSLDRSGFLLNVCLNLDYDKFLQHFIKTIKK
jgi:inosine-uridine nucleoside N-ribohydrolase